MFSHHWVLGPRWQACDLIHITNYTSLYSVRPAARRRHRNLIYLRLTVLKTNEQCADPYAVKNYVNFLYTPKYLNNRTPESMLWDALTLGSVLLT